MKRFYKSTLHIILILVFISMSLELNAQNISKKDALTDFEFLNKAVVNAHGANYHPNNLVNIDTVIMVVSGLKKDSISIQDFRYYLGLALGEIGCLHSSIKDFPLNEQLGEEKFFPVPVLFVNNSLYIDNNKLKAASKFVGQKIESINGYTSAYIVARLLNHLAGDGSENSNAYEQEIASLYAPKLIAYYLNLPPKFIVKTSKGNFTEKASDKPRYQYRSIVPMQRADKILGGEKAYYIKRDSIPILRIEKFLKEDASFWPLIFEELAIEKSPNFVIDLRGNGGGSREAGAELMRFLTKDEFKYAILQPKRKPKPYLNKQGKRYYRFSKLKYNVGQFSHKKNTDLGKSFEFRFKPQKSTYVGQIIVLTDGLTASTSTMLTTWLNKHSNATFIGRTAGGGYNGNNGGVFPKITLPCSKTVIRFPLYRVVLDQDYRRENGQKPDIEVKYSVNDWLSKKDRDWEAVLNFVRTKTN